MAFFPFFIFINKFSVLNRAKIVSKIVNEDFIINCSYNHLSSIYKNLNENEKELFLNELESLFYKMQFNGFHYIVITFLKKKNY